MRKFPAFLAIVALALSVSGCYRGNYEISRPYDEYYVMTLFNRSDINVAWFVPVHGEVDCDDAGALPDELGADELNSLIYTAPRQGYPIYLRQSFPTSPLDGYHTDDIVPFYVFDTAVLRDSSWAAIKRDSLWLAKYELSVEAVVKNNYQVCYPD